MNTIKLLLLPGQQIRPGKLNDAIKAAGFTFNASHNTTEAIVECAAADEAAIRALIATHLATDWAAQDVVDAKIKVEEAKVDMPRWGRELYIAVGPDAAFRAKVQAVENAIAAERAKK